MKLRKVVQSDESKERPDTIPDEDAVETASNMSGQSEGFYNSNTSNHRQSVATTAGEHFVDAETGDDPGQNLAPPAMDGNWKAVEVV